MVTLLPAAEKFTKMLKRGDFLTIASADCLSARSFSKLSVTTYNHRFKKLTNGTGHILYMAQAKKMKPTVLASHKVWFHNLFHWFPKLLYSPKISLTICLVAQAHTQVIVKV